MLDALFFKVDKAFGADCFADSFARFVGINADDIELTDGVLVYKVAVDLGPAEACNLSVMNAEEETFWIKPRFLHSVFKICHRPISLVGVGSEDEVVEIEPGLVMNFWDEGNELIVIWNMRDGFFERTMELKNVAHG